MGVRSKTIISVVLVTIVIGVLVLNTENRELFKGQISGDKEVETAITEVTTALPDLEGELKLIAPDNSESDIQIDATIKNNGEGVIKAETPFTYTVYINDKEVFSNADFYSTMEAGDSFNFIYPIPRTIYQYENTGTIKFVVDSDDSIEENNEDNNEVEQEYSF